MLGVISIYGPHSSGKTGLIERILERFGKWRILVLKKTHQEYLDTPGKDTHRLLERAWAVAAASKREWVLIRRNEGDLMRFIEDLRREMRPDLIIVEGFLEGVPSVAMPGDERGNPTLVYDGDDEAVFRLVEREILKKRVYDILPHLDCGECGEVNCEAFARAVIERGRKVSECKYHNPGATLSLTVNGQPVYLGPFVHELMENVLMGILRSLKAPKDIREFELRYRRR